MFPTTISYSYWKSPFSGHVYALSTDGGAEWAQRHGWTEVSKEEYEKSKAALR